MLNSGGSFQRVIFLIACIAALTAVTTSQTPTPTPSGMPAEDKGPASADVRPSPSPVNHPELHRWLDVDTLSISTRYRLIHSRGGVNTSDQLQWQLAFRGRFKFDREGKYSIYGETFTGNGANSGWNNLGPGTGPFQSNLFQKQLYFDAKPVKGLETQVGGLGFSNGVNTEITTYDNDYYLMGERVRVTLPRRLFFDEISVTNAYVSPAIPVSVFRRFRYLDKSNYHQFLVRKQLNKQVSFSADYTFEQGRDTLHEAVQYKLPKHKLLDTILYENYQRVSPNHGFGFNIFGEKAITRKLTLNGGFARIDLPLTNSDRFPQGDRLYFSGAYKLTPELTLSSIVIQGVGELPPSPNTVRTRFEVQLQYNVLETLHRLKVL